MSLGVGVKRSGKVLTQIHGVIHGKQIELERAPDLPSGSIVLVQIEPQPLTLEEKRELVDSLCGAWSDDPSIEPIFAEIEQQRDTIAPRKVQFDVAS